MNLFKKSITRYVCSISGSRVPKSHPTARKVIEKSRKWYASLRDEAGKRKHIALSTDRGVSQRMLAEKLQEIEQRRHGILTPQIDAAKRPLAEHLREFRSHLLAKQNTSEYIKHVLARLSRTIDANGWQRLGEINADGILRYLTGLLDPGRSTARFVNNLAPGTVNQYLAHWRTFCKWLIERNRLQVDPMRGVKNYPTDPDVRRRRRILDTPDLKRLLQTAKVSDRVVGGSRKGAGYEFAGIDRWRLYVIAVNTGFRSLECASLTPRHFDFDRETVRIDGKDSKNARTDHLPLSRTLLKLKPWILSLPEDRLLFPGSWADKHVGGSILKRDLRDAGIPYVTSAGQYDFHALRHQFCTLLFRCGVPLETVQRLMRHSDIKLTNQIYNHATGCDDAAREAIARIQAIS